MDSKIEEAAKRVCLIQAEYDGMDHNTTGATFMQEHGAEWKHKRDGILGEIDARRTMAIWSLDRLLNGLARQSRRARVPVAVRACRKPFAVDVSGCTP
jgi:hypothetical protein